MEYGIFFYVIKPIYKSRWIWYDLNVIQSNEIGNEGNAWKFLPKEDISPYLDLKMTIGKYSNHSLKEILEEDPQYLNHILKKSDQVPTQLIEACKILKKEYMIS